MLKAEWEAIKDKGLTAGKWTEVYLDDEMPTLHRRYYCGDCGTYNGYGKTPYCPYCGKRKPEVELWNRE